MALVRRSACRGKTSAIKKERKNGHVQELFTFMLCLEIYLVDWESTKAA